MIWIKWDWVKPVEIERLFLPKKVYHIKSRKLTEEINQIIKEYANELEELQ